MSTDSLRTSDAGAVAVVVAICTVLFVGIAAFTVDLGLASANKRDVQKGADAGALAAASEIVKRTAPNQSCAQIANLYATNAGFKNGVLAAADNYAQGNKSFSLTRVGDLAVTCSSDGKRVEVAYAASGTTPRIFGAVFGTGDLVSNRSAAADVFVRTRGTGLRPYFICNANVAALQATSGTNTFAQVQYPNPDSSNCPANGGNWYTADCPNDGNNGTLDTNTKDGCSTEIGPVIDQDTSPSPTQAAINAAIVASCTDATQSVSTLVPSSCLLSNPGNVAANNVVQAWDYLLTLDGIAVPTFNKAWTTYASTQVTKCKNFGGGGNDVCYPIEGLAAVKVCAYKWGNNKTGKATEVACPGVTALTFPNDNNNYLYLRLTGLVFSGSTKPSNCGLGSSCDLGGRGTRLIR